MQLTRIRELWVEAPLSSGHAFLSAASGMVICDNLLCVIADDENTLVLFARDNHEPGRLVRLIDEPLPQDAAERKKVKPDFEILLALPPSHGSRLLALGSGSKKRRMRGAIIDLSAKGDVMAIRLIDLKMLYDAIAALVPKINLEGAVICDDTLLLFNRGNMDHPASHILEVALSSVVDESPVAVTLRSAIRLPDIAGVPLTVTDATRLDNGHFLLSAVAEATKDSCADGALLGAAIVELDAQLAVISVEPIAPLVKIEGIAAGTTSEGIELNCVTDADDPDQPSALYSANYRPR